MGLQAAVITVSDKGARGEREDLSGQAIIEILGEIGIEVSEYRVIPDEEEKIKELLLEFADRGNHELIITTGGTGVSPRDVTPDATLKVIEKEIPGIAEAMRHASITITPHAMISRAVAGIRKRSLIINLPGSPRAVRDNLSVVLPALRHAIEKIKGDQSDCAV
jgi:molybdenum cofactor synthesis domain-containing protein